MEHWFKEKIDFMTLGLTLLLVGTGFVAMYSATYDAGASVYFYRHLLWAGIGLLLMVSIALVPFRTLQLISYPAYVLSVLFLIGVLIIGKTVAGSKSWFGLGTLGLQPAEFAKAAVILALASYLSDRTVNLRRFKDLATGFAIVLIPTALIVAQPDVGTALIFLGIILPVLYWAGGSPFFLLAIIAPGLAAVAALFGTTAFIIVIVATFAMLFLLHENRFLSAIVSSITVLVGISVQFMYGKLQPYQQRRIDTFFNPEADPLGAGYNVIQSKIAIGSGGIFGKGWLQGTQTQLNFIPAQWTDFIFCVPGEEFGFFGSLVILTLFIALFVRGVRVASIVKSPYASVVAIGVISVLAVHTIINIGMSMGLFPVIGIPLPFLSYGGSHLITNMVMIGFLLNVYMNRKEY
jgi:rod shape determining protein RodA